MATHRGQQRDKPFRDALRMEIAAAGEDLPALRKVAAALIGKATKGDVNAIREIADRLDGKVPQGIGQAPELDKLEITWKSNKSSSTMNQESNSSHSTIAQNGLLALLPIDEQVKQ